MHFMYKFESIQNHVSKRLEFDLSEMNGKSIHSFMQTHSNGLLGCVMQAISKVSSADPVTVMIPSRADLRQKQQKWKRAGSQVARLDGFTAALEGAHPSRRMGTYKAEL